MKKPDYNKLILQELKEIKALLKPEVSGVKESTTDKLDLDNPDKYIKLEMKEYMTPRWLFEECRKEFNIFMYEKKFLDETISDRKGDYTVYFKNVQEADEENKNLSADDLKLQKIKGITLEERLLLELVYFRRYKKHLDEFSITLCSGSRHRYVSVPSVFWDSGSGEVYVSWYHPDDADGNLRARSAVLIK